MFRCYVNLYLVSEAKVHAICSPLAAEGIVYLIDGEYNFFQSPINPGKLEMMQYFIGNSGPRGCSASTINSRFGSMFYNSKQGLILF